MAQLELKRQIGLFSAAMLIARGRLRTGKVATVSFDRDIFLTMRRNNEPRR